MALSITLTDLRPAGGRFKGRKAKIVKFVGDASYTGANGYVVAASSLGMRIVESGVIGSDRKGTYHWAIIPSATATSVSTNQISLKAFDSAGATVAASTADIASATIDAIVFGY